MKELIFISAAIAAVVGTAIASYQVGRTQDSYSPVNVVSDIRVTLLNKLESLTPDRRDVAEKLLPVIEDVANSILKENENERSKELDDAGEKFKAIVNNIPIANYDANESPIILTLNKSVLICGRAISMSYAREINKDQYPGYVAIKVNGVTRRVNPGDLYRHSSSDTTVTLRYLEFLKKSSEPVIMFECETENGSNKET